MATHSYKYILAILLFYSHLYPATYANKHHHPLPFQKGIGVLPTLKSYIPHPSIDDTPRPSTANCSLYYHQQPIDHFSLSSSLSTSKTFQQRYFVNTNYWKPNEGPILLYTGNEANVELYINATGFMWEHAEVLNAALLFVEHRYYGQSLPYNTSQEEDYMEDDAKLKYLTVEQALEDYIAILAHFKKEYQAENSAVIAIGGSYGGMLSAWIRMKYPNHVDGAIASSAPLLAFFDQNEALADFGHGESYWQIVTNDASAKGGSVSECAENVHAAFRTLFRLSSSSFQNLQRLTDIFHICSPLQTSEDIQKLALMYLNAWDTMAMGNYPFPSNYLIFQQTMDVNVKLPAFPVRAACQHMSGTFPIKRNNMVNDEIGDDDDIKLLSALRDAGGVYYNTSGTTKCYNLPTDINFDGIWDYQFCTQLLPQETYFARDGINDMFWQFHLKKSDIETHCKQSFPSSKNGPDWNWFQNMYRKAKDTLSNVVFTNGAYDPWTSGGIPPPGLSKSVPSFVIEEGAHHLDLMFSDVEHDPESVVKVRKMEVEYIKKWVAEKKKDVKKELLRGGVSLAH